VQDASSTKFSRAIVEISIVERLIRASLSASLIGNDFRRDLSSRKVFADLSALSMTVKAREVRINGGEPSFCPRLTGCPRGKQASFLHQ